jgi:PAS domain S-box-containing protein
MNPFFKANNPETAAAGADQALALRLRYEEGIAGCSRALLSENEPAAALRSALEQLLRASGADRVYVFENFTDDQGELCMRQTFEVCAPEVEPQIHHPELQHVPYKKGYTRWRRELSRNNALAGLVSDFPKEERGLLQEQGILSVLEIPLWVEEQWFGYIGFDDTTTPRRWLQEDIRLLRTASEMISRFLEQKKKEQELRSSRARFDLMLNTILDGLVTVNTDGTITYTNDSVGRILGVPADSLIGTLYYNPDWKQQDENSGSLAPDRLPLSIALHEQRSVQHVEHSIVDGSGAKKWLSVNAAPLLTGQGKLEGAIASFRDITEQKTTERMLKESELRYRTLLESLPDSVFVLDREYRHLVVNQAAEQFTGMLREKLIGAKLADLFPGIEKTRFYACFQRVMEDRRPETVTDRFEFPDGRQGWYELDVYPVPEGILCISRDITEKKAAEESLRQSEQRYRNLAESLPLGVYEAGMDMKARYLNRTGLELLGLSSEDLAQGFDSMELIPQSEMNKLEKDLSELQAGHSVGPTEYTIIRRDGTPLPVMLRSIPYMEDGEISGFRGIIEDLTEQRERETMLNMMGSAIESSISAIAFVNPDGIITYLNQSFLKMWGFSSADEGMGIPVFDLINFRKPDGTTVLDELKSAGMWTGELSATRRDGQFFKVQVLANMVSGVNDGSRFFVISAIDITEKQRMEEALRQAHKMEAVGRLAGGIAHEFNNLLTVVLGNTDLLLMDDEMSSASQDPLVSIKKATERGAALVQQLLAYGRRQMSHTRVVDLNEILRNYQTMLRHLVGERIDLVMSLDPKLHPVEADPEQIRQIVMNLVANARDAIPQEGTITVRTTNVRLNRRSFQGELNVKEGSYTLLSVHDTGYGLDEKTKQHLFEPFYTTKGLANRPGLGLSSVYGIVKQSGGYILVRSEKGRGATFDVYLPRAAEKEGAAAEPEDESSAMNTVLVVEDDELVRSMITGLLRRNGFRVIDADTGGEALSRVKKENIDLLITDVMMPGMTGPELAADLLRTRPELKVLYISGYPDSYLQQHGIEAASSTLVRKPFSPDRLLHRVRTILE